MTLVRDARVARAGALAVVLASIAMSCGGSGAGSVARGVDPVLIELGVLEGARCGLSAVECGAGEECVVFDGIDSPAVCVDRPCDAIECPRGACAIRESFPAQVGCASTGGAEAAVFDCTERDRCLVEVDAATLAQLDASARDGDGDGVPDLEQLARRVARATAFLCQESAPVPQCAPFPACSSPTTCDQTADARAAFVLSGLRAVATSEQGALVISDARDRLEHGPSYYPLGPCGTDDALRIVAVAVPGLVALPDGTRPGCVGPRMTAAAP